MLIVVDANILVSELIRSRGRMLVASPELPLRISDAAWSEARHELSFRAHQTGGTVTVEYDTRVYYGRPGA